MPVYDYECACHGVFSAIRPMSEYNKPSPCPDCSEMAPRVLISAPYMSTIGASVRQAHDSNERAKHAPISSEAYRAKHAAGCSCCNGNKKDRALKNAPQLKTFPTRRPWMISH
ncbi:zinc ribbon domain-containing protein [Hyphomicrobium sp.]|uniref:FmdB family zinc ribbon protein n=1 Tax=Hyphomicrobium sp. TaxID=82 RepID=UPI002E32AB58|nr:zinc ribbon domain-containing protein [Hyphomicrobium sp.]HEX2840040.1 zinc ribbon domain-containing protein [Hyphomicrobium sp.]